MSNSLIETLEPIFGVKIANLVIRMNGITGRDWRVVQGRRTIAEQNSLYAQGRTSPGKVVTKAPGGSSAHNFGLAADLAPMKSDGSDIDWGASRDLFQKLADTAQNEFGLVAGFYFHSLFDPDHIESPDWKDEQAKWKSGELSIA